MTHEKKTSAGGVMMSEDNLIIKIETEEYIYWEYTEA